jgi:adenosylcobinamide-GDP ribazoletransferase
MIKKFLGTVAFLTIIPVNKKYQTELKDSVIFFPLVGLLIGCILLLVYRTINTFLQKSIIDIIIVLISVIITGGLHIDGFSDTIDGICSNKNKNEILKIMDDSRIGVMGTIGIFFLLIFKYILLNNLTENTINSALLLMPTLGRYNMIFSGKISLPIKQTGLGNIFITNIRNIDLIITTIYTLIITVLLLKQHGLILFLTTILLTTLITKYLTNKIGGMTGDCFGTVNEITEIFVLFYFVLLIQ